MNNYTEITALDWAILDALADDYESINEIHAIVISSTAPAQTKADILNRVEKLFQDHFIFLTLNLDFTRRVHRMSYELAQYNNFGTR